MNKPSFVLFRNKTPFPFPFKRLPRRNDSSRDAWKAHEWVKIYLYSLAKGTLPKLFSFFDSLRDGYLSPPQAVSFLERVNRITISVGC